MSTVAAFSKALAQMGDKAFQKVIWLSIILTLVLYAAVIAGLYYYFFADLQVSLPLIPDSWNQSLSDMVQSGLVLVLIFAAALIFPGVATVLMGLFLDDIAEAVEKRYYPDDPVGKPLALGPTIWESVKFAALLIVVNILVIPAYFIPGVNVALYYVMNGYFLSRQYFEMVAWRHMPLTHVYALRRRVQWRIFPAGLIIAFIMTIPVLNILAPVVLTAVMVHLFKRAEQRYKNSMSANNGG